MLSLNDNMRTEIFYLKPLKDKRIIRETDADIDALIEKYKDVFPENLPPGLPPKRTVEMTINLENGSKPKIGSSK